MKFDDKIVRTVFNTLDSLLVNKSDNSNNSILLALSGGSDSVCLLDILSKIQKYLKIDISLAHMNYSGKDSSEMENLCKSISKKYSYPIFIKKISLSQKNFESIARKTRYDYFNLLSKKYSFDYILTAHQKEDQIETIYMKEEDDADWISRIGIRLQLGKILRPMLYSSKSQIAFYLKKYKLDYVYDSTNDNIHIRRNYVRKIIIPDILKNNPDFLESIYDKSKIYYSRLNDLSSSIDRDLIKKIKDDPFKISLEKKILLKYSVTELKFVIQKIISIKMCISNIQLSRSAWIEFKRFLKNGKSGKKFPLSNIIDIVNDRDYFFIVRKKYIEDLRPVAMRNNLNWRNSFFSMTKVKTKIMSSSKKYVIINNNIINSGIYVREWKYGDRIMTQSGNNVKVKKLLINKKIALPNKKNVPIVVDSKDTILWIPDIAHSSFSYPDIGPFIKISCHNEL